MEHHGAALQKLVDDSQLVEKIKKDYRVAELSEKTREVLDFSCKLTHQPAEVKDGDIARLKELGFSDREILDICQVTAYFNFVNRMADALGIELEE